MHVGIDLGTTFSSVAVFDREKGRPAVVANRYGSAGTPSVLCFREGEVLFGEDAKELLQFGEPNSIAFYKRNMGDPNFFVRFFGKNYSAEDLSALFLQKLIADAEQRLGQKITEAVITVPAYFDNRQREATIRAGEKAGVKVLRIINEPTAAAIAYGLQNAAQTKTFLVYDLGGGTFDVTAVRITPGGITVLGTDGDHQLGGKNWDDAIVEYLAQQVASRWEVDILENAEDAYELLMRAEKAKKELTSKNQVTIPVAFGGQKEDCTLTLALFNDITRDLMERTKMLCAGLLSDIGMAWSDFDGVLLVGGSTRMRMVSDFVEEMSGKPAVTGVNVDEAVALGAAVQAEMELRGREAPSFTLGSAPTPAFTLGPKISDVTAHSLGMVSVSADRKRFINSILIPKNNPVPSSSVKPFKIVSDYCVSGETEVYILQGESENPLECAVLGRYVISGIETSKSREVILDIRYDYDENGVVKVSAAQRKSQNPLFVRVEEVPGDLSWMAAEPDSIKSARTQPVTVVMAFDLSGSMAGGPLREAQKAAKKLTENLDLTNSSVSIVGFSNNIRVFCEPVRSLRKIENAIDAMEISGELGYGNSAHPFQKVKEMLEKVKTRNFLIVLADGNWGCRREASQWARECVKAGIETIAIGFGDVDRNFLNELASTNENALLTNLENLTQSFSNIAQAITESGEGKGLRFSF